MPHVFDMLLNQIPEEWHQVAVKFRKTNEIRGDILVLELISRLKIQMQPLLHKVGKHE